MKTIKAKKLTKENFSKYGDFCNLYAPETMGMGVGTPSAFYPDAMTFNFGGEKRHFRLRLPCKKARYGYHKHGISRQWM